MPYNASQGFTELLTYVDQLIQIHGRLQTGRGRRHQQEALHRSGVVLTVAAWESYVQSVIEEAIDLVRPPDNAPFWSRSTFIAHENSVRTDLGRFHTPNKDNVQRIMRTAVGFEPVSHWEWRVGPRQWDSAEMSNRLNAWLDIRHTIAHGAELPTEIDWIKNTSGTPRITLTLLRECRRFFEHLVEQTDKALADHISNALGVPVPW